MQVHVGYEMVYQCAQFTPMILTLNIHYTRIGRILIARGRDAADAALTTSFGASTLESFRVWTDEVAAP